MQMEKSITQIWNACRLFFAVGIFFPLTFRRSHSQNRNVLYLITNLCRPSEKAAAVFAGLHPLEWLPAAKGRLKTSRQTIPFSADTWSWAIEQTPDDSRRNRFAESSSVQQKTSICPIGNPFFQQRHYARWRRDGQFSVFQRYKRNTPAKNHPDCRIPVSR